MEGIFKTAMNGFKKSDVLEFIDRQETEYKQREKELGDRIASLTAELDGLRREKQELHLKNIDLSAQLENERRGSAGAAERIKAAEDEAASLRADFARAETLAGEMGREVALHRHSAEKKAAELAEKAAEIERLKHTINTISLSQQRISRVMVEAQSTADKIVENARKEAVSILREASKKLAAMVREGDAFAGELETLRAKVGCFTGSLSDLGDEFREFTGALEGCVRVEAPAAKPGHPQAAPEGERKPDAPETAARPFAGPRFDFSKPNPAPEEPND